MMDPLTQNFRVLVAGGAGFIGSHLVDRLIKADFEVTVIDNLYSGQMENLKQHEQNKNFSFVKGDVRNFELVKKLVKSVDAVFNLSAIVSVPRSIKNPLLVNDVNVKGTLNLLKASMDNNVKRFVQASSASVYGDANTLPVEEDLAPRPISPYAVSKLAADTYAEAFYRVYGLETVCLRYFNVYGPRQRCNPYSGVITIFTNELMSNRPPKIFGDGEQTRDFVFIEDVVSANMLALTKESAVGQVFNIAAGEATTLKKLVQVLQKILDKTNLKPVYKKPRCGDIRHSYASIEKARNLLSYEPMFPLEKGLKALVNQLVQH